MRMSKLMVAAKEAEIKIPEEGSLDNEPENKESSEVDLGQLPDGGTPPVEDDGVHNAEAENGEGGESTNPEGDQAQEVPSADGTTETGEQTPEQQPDPSVQPPEQASEEPVDVPIGGPDNLQNEQPDDQAAPTGTPEPATTDAEHTPEAAEGTAEPSGDNTPAENEPAVDDTANAGEQTEPPADTGEPAQSSEPEQPAEPQEPAEPVESVQAGTAFTDDTPVEGEGEGEVFEGADAQSDAMNAALDQQEIGESIVENEVAAQATQKLTVTLESLLEDMQAHTGGFDPVSQSVIASTLGDAGAALGIEDAPAAAIESNNRGGFAKAVESMLEDTKAANTSLQKTVGQRVGDWYTSAITQMRQTHERISKALEGLPAELAFQATLDVNQYPYLVTPLPDGATSIDRALALAGGAVINNLDLAAKIDQAPDLMNADLASEAFKYFSKAADTTAPAFSYVANNGVGASKIEFDIRPVAETSIAFSTDRENKPTSDASVTINNDQALTLGKDALAQIDLVIAKIESAMNNANLEQPRVSGSTALYHHIGTMIVSAAVFTFGEVAQALEQ